MKFTVTGVYNVIVSTILVKRKIINFVLFKKLKYCSSYRVSFLYLNIFLFLFKENRGSYAHAISSLHIDSNQKHRENRKFLFYCLYITNISTSTICLGLYD